MWRSDGQKVFVRLAAGLFQIPETANTRTFTPARPGLPVTTDRCFSTLLTRQSRACATPRFDRPSATRASTRRSWGLRVDRTASSMGQQPVDQVPVDRHHAGHDPAHAVHRSRRCCRDRSTAKPMSTPQRPWLESHTRHSRPWREARRLSDVDRSRRRRVPANGLVPTSTLGLHLLSADKG